MVTSVDKERVGKAIDSDPFAIMDQLEDIGVIPAEDTEKAVVRVRRQGDDQHRGRLTAFRPMGMDLLGPFSSATEQRQCQSTCEREISSLIVCVCDSHT